MGSQPRKGARKPPVSAAPQGERHLVSARGIPATVLGGSGPGIRALDPEFTSKGVATAGMLGSGQVPWLSLPYTVQGVNDMDLAAS